MAASSESVETGEVSYYQLREDVDYDVISSNTRGDPAVGGACIDAAGIRPPANQPWWVQQFPCNGGLNQNIRLVRSVWHGSAWEVRSAADDDYCLDVPSSNYASGQRLQFYPCNGGRNQSWDLVPHTSDYARFSIRPYPSSSMCLDVANATPDTQATIQLYRCHGQANQLWYVREVVKRDSLYETGWLSFFANTSTQRYVSVPAGSVATFATSGGRVSVSGASTPYRYVCDTGNFDTNRIVVDHRTSNVKVSCLHH